MSETRSRPWCFPVLAVLLSTVVALVLLEVLLRVEYTLRQRYKPSLAFVADDLGWLPTPDLTTSFFKRGYGEVQYSTNRYGFRRVGHPTGGETRVWAVGDSTTQAYQVSDDETYYAVLAKLEPSLETFGYGVGGYGTVQQAMALERFWDRVEPDVVVWQMCANDWINNDWELESASNEHNNHMARPYLIDGRIELRHPDGYLGWLARRSLLVRRIAVLRTSLRKRTRGSIEAELNAAHPAVRRVVASTREAIERITGRHPDVLFLSFFVPSPERYEWEAEVWEEVCGLADLECLPEGGEAVEAARRAGAKVDGGEDPHWNAAGHEIVARTILERLRRGPKS